MVSRDTEFFNGQEWKKVSEYSKGDKILQYNEDGIAELVNPSEYVHCENDEPFYRYISPYLSSCQTGNQAVVYIGDGALKKLKQREILDKGLLGVPVSCIYNGGMSMSQEQVAELVDSVEFEGSRGYSDLSELSIKTKKMIFDTLYDEGITYKSPIDGMIMYKGRTVGATKSIASMMNTMGFSAGFVTDYCLDIIACNAISGYNTQEIKFSEVSDNQKYGFVVPSHMLVLRYEGRVYITGDYSG